MNVFFRWVPILSLIPSFSMGWFDEIVEMLFAWLVFCASSLLCKNRDHFKVDLLQMHMQGRRSVYLLEFIINLATLVFFCGAVVLRMDAGKGGGADDPGTADAKALVIHVCTVQCFDYDGLHHP